MRSNAIANIPIHPNTLRPEREISSTVDVFAQTAKNPTLVSAILAPGIRQAAGRLRQARGIAWPTRPLGGPHQS
jgi:hypothetical protein